MRIGNAAPAVTLALLLCLPRSAIGAGGAYAVDDADIGPVASCQNEAWVSSATSRDFVGLTAPACVVKLGIPVELTAVFQRSATHREWTTASGGQAKIVPINNDRFAVSFAAGALWDSATRSTSGFLNIPLTFKFGPAFKVHTDMGVFHDSRVNVTYAMGGVGFEWDFVPKFSLQGEIYMQEGRRLEPVPRTATQPRSQFGLRYMPADVIDIDVIYGQNLTGHNAHWLTLGLTVRTQ